jgi:two-component system chemotaxis sensor kinase CheA
MAGVVRSDDTIAMFADFLAEADEGLNQAEAVLMNADRNGMNEEGVHALFRVFHTIKGVAGFIDLDEVQSFAHTVETLMDQARDGRYRIDKQGIDVLLGSTQVMRDMLEVIESAVKRGVEIPHVPSVEGVLASLNRLIQGTPAEADPRLPRNAEALLADLPPVEPEAPAPKPDASLRHTIKLDLERVDLAVEMIGELVILESMLSHAPELEEGASAHIRAYLSQLSKISRDLQSVAMLMRMVPVRSAFQRLPIVAREAAKQLDKEVQVQIEGEETEMDRSMVDGLAEPLVHMIRNSVDHGLEPGREREASNKPRVGSIFISAYHEGSSVVIEVRDDGRGLDKKRILAKALDRGLIRPEQELSEEEVHQLIFMPGFSTAKEVTAISGRGVGLDVVKRSVEAMRGRLVIKSEPGRGTSFKLVLPLTLAIIDATIVACGEERYIIPSLSIVETLRPTAGMVGTMGGSRELLRFRGGVLPLFRAARLFGVDGAELDPTRAMVVIVADSMSQKVAMLVDGVIGQQQVVIRSLDGTLAASSSFVGAAIISDGRVALIVNVDDLGRIGETQSLAACRQEEEAA